MINPIAGSGIVQSSAAQRVQADDKADQLRKAEQRKNNTPSNDSYEPAVASPNEIDPISDRQSNQQRRQTRQQTAARRRPPGPSPDDQTPRLDVTA